MPRTTAPRVFRSVPCPVDFSNNSCAALRYAVMLARLSDAHLFVLYVTDPLLATAAASRPDVRAMLASSNDDLCRFVSSVTSRSTPAVTTTVLTIAGQAAAEIDVAREPMLLALRPSGRPCIYAAGAPQLWSARMYCARSYADGFCVVR
jgi:hypothetical protein